LSIQNSAVSDSGRYFARIVNFSQKMLDTDTVMLGVKGLRAHWTLDQSDFTGTHYLDVAEGYDLIAFASAYQSHEPAYDLTGVVGAPDGQVNLFDFAEVCASWLDDGLYP